MKKTFWNKLTARGTRGKNAVCSGSSGIGNDLFNGRTAGTGCTAGRNTAAVTETVSAQQETAMPTLQTETPELAARDPEAPPVQATEAEENSTNQHTPENSVVLTPEEIRAALDAGAMDAAEAQCIDLSDENGFFQLAVQFPVWLAGQRRVPAGAGLPGWRTSGGKTYYYSQTTNKPVTGIQCIDNKLYSFNADGDAGKWQDIRCGMFPSIRKYRLEPDQKGRRDFVIAIGYRGYGASGTLVLGPMFEEHFTNVRKCGPEGGRVFLQSGHHRGGSQGRKPFACAYVLNGRKLDYPIF